MEYLIRNNECYNCLNIDSCVFTGIVHSICYNKKVIGGEKLNGNKSN